MCSKVGGGTCYTVRLPFKIDPDPKIKEEKKETVSLKGKKALLVEDNDLNLEIAKFLLEQEDIEVTTAVNGQEAAGMNEHLIKPVDGEQLSSTMKKYLANKI